MSTTKLLLSQGTRICKLRTKDGIIEGHRRAVTSTDVGYTRDLLTAFGGPRIELPHDIGEVLGRYGDTDFQKLLDKNGPGFAIKRDEVQRNLHHMPHALATLVRPHLLPGTIVDDQRSLALLELAVQSGCTWALITDSSPGSQPKEFGKRLEFSQNWLEKEGATRPNMPMGVPSLSMAMAPQDLLQKMKIVKDMGFSAVNVVYAPVGSAYWATFIALRRMVADMDIWVHMSGIPRHGWQSLRLKVSMPHFLQFMDINSFALGIPPRFQLQPGQDSVYDVPLKSASWFNVQDCGVPNATDFMNMKGEKPLCFDICPIGQMGTLPQILGKAAGKDVIPPVTKLHETFCSAEEFKRGDAIMLKEGSEAYIKQRQYLSKAFRNIYFDSLYDFRR